MNYLGSARRPSVPRPVGKPAADQIVRTYILPTPLRRENLAAGAAHGDVSMLAHKRRALLLTLAAICGLTSFARAADPPTTLWNFLGIPQGIRKIQGATINRRGNFPGLERKPPLRAIADPIKLE